jgi:DNA-binding helix-hairpin-helix protein with protein kinase domain
MSADLQTVIRNLAQSMAAEIVQALRGLSVDEIARLDHRPSHRQASSRRTPKGAASGKAKTRQRRDAKQLQAVVDKLVAVVKANKKGINAEGIRAALKLPRKELPRPIALALKSKKIRKRGQKRATTYYAG